MVATRSSKSPDINVGKSSKSVTFDTDVLKPKMRTKSIPTGMKKEKNVMLILGLRGNRLLKLKDV